MHKKYKFSFIISLILCVTLVFNANTFKRYTYAVVAAVPVAVAVGDVVITVSASAVAALIGCISGCGVNISSIDSGSAFIDDWYQFRYGHDLNAPDALKSQVRSDMESLGFSVTETDDGNIVIDVPEHKAGTFTFNPDGIYSNLEWFQGGNLPQGSEPSNNGGKRKVAGFLASSVGLGSLGVWLYDYLHHSDTVSVVKPDLPVVKGSYTTESIKDTMCSIIAEACANNFKDGFASNDYYDVIYNSSFLDRYFRSYIEDCVSFDVYVDYSYYINSKNDQGMKKLNLVFLFTSSSGKCFLRRFDCNCAIPIGSSCLYGTPGASSSEFDNYSLALASTVLTFESTDNNSLTSIPVSQLNHTATYINTSVVTDYEPELDPAVSPDKVVIGDNEYSLDPEGNVYDNPDYLTDSVAPATDPDTQEVIVTVPAFDPEGNIIPEPSVEPDSEPALDPFVNPDIGLNPSPSDDVMTSGNIFTLLASFFNTFWQNLKQTFTNVLNYFLTNLLNGIKGIFIPDVSVIENCVDNIKNTFLTTFGIGDFDISLAFGGEASLVDIPIDYETPDFHFFGIAVSYKYVIEALIIFRPYIRGLLCLLMCIYSINQFLGLINQMGITLGAWGTTPLYMAERPCLEHYNNGYLTGNTLYLTDNNWKHNS